MNKKLVTLCAAGLLAAPLGAMASVTVTQGSSAPTYSMMLDFDEPGGPTGAVSPDAWQSLGISELQSGDSSPQVGPWGANTGQPWLGDGNSFTGTFGVFLTFDSDVSAMSLQAWDPSGPPSPFGGGLGVFVFNDGVEVAAYAGLPAWDGSGDEWFDIVASSGAVFDEVRILGFGFFPTTYVDNLSWQTAVVPVPAAIWLLFGGLASLAGFRRKRG